jgi:hypothetical protein
VVVAVFRIQQLELDPFTFRTVTCRGMADHLAIHARSAGLLGLALALQASSIPELQEILLTIDGLLRV